jgi:hypothetical protein
MSFQWVDDAAFLSDCALAELDAPEQCLFGLVRTLDGGLPLFHFLVENARSLRTADDIAFRLKQPPVQVQCNLERLYRFDLVRKLEVAGLTWYGITVDEKKSQQALNLCAWQNRWSVRLEQLHHAIHGKTTLTNSHLHADARQ